MTHDIEGGDFQRWIAYGRKRGWVSRNGRVLEPYDDEADEGVMPANWTPGTFAGRGPKDYVRSDQSIEDELYKRLTHHPDLDAADMEIGVLEGIVSLRGYAANKYEKRLAEEIARDVLGVSEVKSELRFKEFGFQTKSSSGSATNQQSDAKSETTDE
ncbi:MAG: BON domain-containing protein [Candidatus Obscuribacterales bacterium]